jgi:hypothetical protein
MKRSLMALTVVWLVLAGVARGEDESRRDLAEELMVLMKIPENIEKSFAMVKKMLPTQMEQMGKMSGQTNMPPEALMQSEKIVDVVASELSWEKVKNEYIVLYAETLTEDELKAAITFYKTPEGQSFVNKQPELMRRAMELNQKLMAKIMPRLQEMTKDMRKSTTLQ